MFPMEMAQSMLYMSDLFNDMLNQRQRLKEEYEFLNSAPHVFKLSRICPPDKYYVPLLSPATRPRWGYSVDEVDVYQYNCNILPLSNMLYSIIREEEPDSTRPDFRLLHPEIHAARYRKKDGKVISPEPQVVIYGYRGQAEKDSTMSEEWQFISENTYQKPYTFTAEELRQYGYSLELVAT